MKLGCIYIILLSFISNGIKAQNISVDDISYLCDSETVNAFAPESTPYGGMLYTTCAALPLSAYLQFYMIRIESGNTFTFTLTPDANVDYDFAVWKNPNLSNLGQADRGGQNDPTLTGIYDIGLNLTSPEECEGIAVSGWPEPGFVRYLDVTPGDYVLIAIDRWSSTDQGFSMTFGGDAVLDCTVSDYYYEYCDTDNNGTETIYFDELTADLEANYPGNSYTFYDNRNDANIGSSFGVITANHFDASTSNNPNAIYVRTVSSDGSSFGIVTAYFQLNPLPNLSTPQPLSECANGTGQSTFDLTEVETELMSDSTGITFTYYTSELAAENADTGQIITNKTAYTTTSTSVFVRAENDNNGCFSVEKIDLIANLVTLSVDMPNTICTGSQTTLQATTQTGNTIYWYDSETSNAPIDSGNIFNTPILTTTTSYWAEAESADGNCTSDRIKITIDVSSSITPQFTLTNIYCENATAEVLPTTSNNGIIGTWSPMTIDTSTIGTQVYTFTPDVGQCAETYSMNIEVTSLINLSFTITENYCEGDTPQTLPTTSNNGITGTWSPATVDTSVVGSQPYIFTSDSGQCSENTYLVTIEISPTATPTFNLTQNYCEGDTPQTLPTTSDNGITGTWSPAIINTSVTGNQLYTFTPDTGQQCAIIYTLNIEVTPQESPVFNLNNDYCEGTTPQTLSTTSDNGITGTWNPTTIDTSTIGIQTYTFTPDAGQCAKVFSITITINSLLDPNFSLIDGYCEGDAPQTLPTASDNGITGTWSPTTIDTSVVGSQTYTFTPNTGECANTFNFIVTVTESIIINNIPTEISICPNSEEMLTVDSGYEVYQWITPDGSVTSTSETVSISQSGIYALTVQDSNYNCDFYQEIIVEYIAPPIITNIVTEGYTITISAIGEGLEYSIDGESWSENPFFENLSPTIYTVYVRDTGGCGQIVSQNVIIGVTNFISPNGDGLNDTWKIGKLDVYPNAKIQIFDRYGKELVSHTQNEAFEWNGTYNGRVLPTGSYWYIITLDDKNKLVGSITIKRH